MLQNTDTKIFDPCPVSGADTKIRKIITLLGSNERGDTTCKFSIFTFHVKTDLLVFVYCKPVNFRAKINYFHFLSTKKVMWICQQAKIIRIHCLLLPEFDVHRSCNSRICQNGDIARTFTPMKILNCLKYLTVNGNIKVDMFHLFCVHPGCVCIIINK